jgi:DNA-binding transcriptional ArsR family regulator
MVTELAQPFAMSLPAISRHIRVLERARLIARHVDGKIRRCTLHASAFRDAEEWLSVYRCFWEGTLQSLADYVEAGSKKTKSSRGSADASR